MKRITVIGTGIMGNGIAKNYLQHGYSVTVWNRTVLKTESLVAKGAAVASTPMAAVQQADIIFEVTANDESSRSVWLGDDGILAGASANAILITSATLSVDWINELGKLCQSQDRTFFDMPMTGGRVAAESGQLTLLVGGNQDKLEVLKPDLTAIAANVKYFGEVSSGTKYKLILNTLQAIHIAGFGEALRMARAVGLNEKTVGAALVERPGGVLTETSWKSRQQAPDPITFSVDWITKDLGYATEMISNLDHPLLDDVLNIYKHAAETGYGQADWTKINDL